MRATKPKKVIIKIDFPTPTYAEAVLRALGPEARTSVSPRSSARIKRVGRGVILELEARDTSALRAVTNSYLRWIMAIKHVVSVVSNG